MKTQKQMFWNSHNKVAMDNLVKNLELARKKRYDAVKQWRDNGAVDSEFDSYVADADRLIEIAENSIDDRLTR